MLAPKSRVSGEGGVFASPLWLSSPLTLILRTLTSPYTAHIRGAGLGSLGTGKCLTSGSDVECLLVAALLILSVRAESSTVNSQLIEPGRSDLDPRSLCWLSAPDRLPARSQPEV